MNCNCNKYSMPTVYTDRANQDKKGQSINVLFVVTLNVEIN